MEEEEIEGIKKFKKGIDLVLTHKVFKTKFTGTNSPDKAMWLNEARSYLVNCSNKLNKILEYQK